MAVAFDAVGVGSSVSVTSNTVNTSWSHTSSGSDRICIVAVFTRTTANVNSVTATYDGVAMTQLGATTVNPRSLRFFYIIGQPTGAKTVAVSASFAASSATGLNAESVSYTGAVSVGSFVVGTVTNTFQNAVTVASTPTGDMAVSAHGRENSGSIFTTYNRTQRYTATNANFAAMLMGDAVGAGATLLMQASMSAGSTLWAAIGAIITAGTQPSANTGAFFAMF